MFVFIFELMFVFLYLHIYVYTFVFICLYLLKQFTFKHAFAAKELRKKMIDDLDYFIEDSGH